MQKRNCVIFVKSQLAHVKDKLRIRKALIRTVLSMAVKLGQ